VQAFPWHSWGAEFELARTCGFDGLEWLFEADRYEENPIWTGTGQDHIRAVAARTGIRVLSICADYFMSHPFVRVTRTEVAQNVKILCQLIACAEAIGAPTVLIPVLEAAEVRSPSEVKALLDALEDPLTVAEARGITLGLETELPAAEFLGLLSSSESPACRAYYDTGNAAAKGFPIVQDVKTLGPYLCGIHLKDRRYGGGSVPLGTGAVDFDGVLKVLDATLYDGPMVLQAASGPAYLELAQQQAAFIRAAMGSCGPIDR
jgi:hexulose-6-phosphate isomerase